jgi:hypothetical protein
VSPLWRPTPKLDRELARSKDLQLQLLSAVKELDRVADLINERAEQIAQEQEPGESQ